jgi:CheY-like chemotaxis protein
LPCVREALVGNKILLVDESVTVQKIITLAFSDEGVEVVTLDNGEDAVAQLPYLRPALVLADVSTPGKNGYQICEFIKRQDELRGIPVILLVPGFETYDEEQARRVGADSHLTKPFQSIRSLVATVKQLLREQGDPREKKGLEAALSEGELADHWVGQGEELLGEVVESGAVKTQLEREADVWELPVGSENGGQEVWEGEMLEDVGGEIDDPLIRLATMESSPEVSGSHSGEALRLAPEVIDEIVSRVVAQLTEALTGRISEEVAARISDSIVAVPATLPEPALTNDAQERLPFDADADSLLELDEF